MTTGTIYTVATWVGLVLLYVLIWLWYRDDPRRHGHGK